MTPPRLRAPALAVLALLLAGCADPTPGAGTAAPAATTPAPDAVPEGAQPAPPGMVAARFADAEPRAESIWANGTLKPEQASRAPGAPIRSPLTTPLVSLDVTDLVPRGVPVILVAEVQAAMTQGDVDIFFAIPPDDFRNGAFDAPRGGFTRAEQGLVRSGQDPVLLNLVYDEAEPAAEVPYTLFASVEFDPTVVRAAFPVGVTLPPGASEVVVELVGARRDFAFDLDVPNLMVWAPDDSFVGHFPLREALNPIPLPSAEGGEHVLLLSQGGRSMRLLTNGTVPAPLRAMPQTFHRSEPHADATPQGVEWTTTYDRVPMLAGVVFEPTTLTPEVSVAITNAAGTLLEGTVAGPWVHVPQVPQAGLVTRFGWDSAYGVPGLAAGDHHVRVKGEGAAGIDAFQARDFAAFWSR